MKKLMLLGLVLACGLGSSFGGVYQSGGGHDRVSVGETIDIGDGDAASNVVCAFCTVRVHGPVRGDLVTFFGQVLVDDGQTISGDAVVFGGKLALANESRIDGQLVLFGANLEQASSAAINGERVVLAGNGWLLVALLPLLLPIGLIWLVVHLVRRNRYRFPAYPGGRRY